MTVRTGTGCSLTMGTTNYDVEILSFSSNGVTVPVVDTTHLGTTTARSKIMGDRPRCDNPHNRQDAPRSAC